MRRALAVRADAVLAALAFALAFKLRFLDVPGGIPERYESMLAGSVAFVALGTRSSSSCSASTRSGGGTSASPTSGRCCARSPSPTALLVLVFALVQPYEDSLPRSVVVFDFLLASALLGGARLARRSIARAPPRARESTARRARCSSSAPAPAARWSSAS